MGNIKITFCVTYYNQEDFVAQSLDSIFALDMPFDFEILVGDDGSSDATVKKVKEYQEKYPNKIKVFIMPRDANAPTIPVKRASANRLNLLSHAVGEYICFLDGDDRFCYGGFAKDAVLKLDNDKSLVACAFDMERVYPDRTVSMQTRLLKEGRIRSKKYVKHRYIHLAAFIFRNNFKEQMQEAFKKYLFDDNTVVVYFLQFGDFYYFDKVALSYRCFDEGMTAGFPEEEKELVNLVFYDASCKVAPKFKMQLLKRCFRAHKTLYYNRKNLQAILGEKKFALHKAMSQELKNEFAISIFNWNELSSWDKLKVNIKFYWMRFVLRKIASFS